MKKREPDSIFERGCVSLGKVIGGPFSQSRTMLSSACNPVTIGELASELSLFLPSCPPSFGLGLAPYERSRWAERFREIAREYGEDVAWTALNIAFADKYPPH